MRVRDGFVSNSSSTSFLVDLNGRSMPALAAEFLLSRIPLANEDLLYLCHINDMFEVPAEANVALTLRGDNFCIPSCGSNTTLVKIGDIAACNASMNDPFTDKRGVAGVRYDGKDKISLVYDGEMFDMAGIEFVDVEMSVSLRKPVGCIDSGVWDPCRRLKTCNETTSDFTFKGETYRQYCGDCFSVLQPFAKTPEEKIAVSSRTVRDSKLEPCHLRDKLCSGSKRGCRGCLLKKKNAGSRVFSGSSNFKSMFGKSFTQLCEEMKYNIKADPSPKCFCCAAPLDLTDFLTDSEHHRMPMEAALCESCLRNIFEIGIYAGIDNL